MRLHYGLKILGANDEVTTYASERGGARPDKRMARANRAVAKAKNADKRNALPRRLGAV